MNLRVRMVMRGMCRGVCRLAGARKEGARWQVVARGFQLCSPSVRYKRGSVRQVRRVRQFAVAM